MFIEAQFLHLEKVRDCALFFLSIKKYMKIFIAG